MHGHPFHYILSGLRSFARDTMTMMSCWHWCVRISVANIVKSICTSALEQIKYTWFRLYINGASCVPSHIFLDAHDTNKGLDARVICFWYACVDDPVNLNKYFLCVVFWWYTGGKKHHMCVFARTYVFNERIYWHTCKLYNSVGIF